MMTNFSEHALEITKRIPKGKVATYADIAKAAGSQGAARSVGSALRKNGIAIKFAHRISQTSKAVRVPCHRVIRSDGSVGCYSGKGNKTGLLVAEGVAVVNGRVELARYKCRPEQIID
ncbi:MAG: MGMT family protein [Candidatus Aenigmarchaeota archaeon]|nr:MGMT family protein [Candidatus Aenigmarchaeota archaeon]